VHAANTSPFVNSTTTGQTPQTAKAGRFFSYQLKYIYIMSKKKLKAIHIHTDYSFVTDSYLFDGELFENETIIFQKKEPFNRSFKHKPILLNYRIRDIKKAIEICKNSDLVVLYDLNMIKCLIALALPYKVKVAWRFFGYELYRRKKELFLSEKSFKFIQQKKKKIYYPLLKIYYYLKYKYIFDKAVKRINYMLVLSNEEYSFLKNIYKTLPEFIQLPHIFFEETLTLPNTKKKDNNTPPTIVIGNNRSSYNNHLDVIELIENNPAKLNYNFTLLFNYGQTGRYYKEVKNRVKNKPYFNLIEDFIPPEEFNDFYQNISALVINSYRQMAAANIFLALRNGVKVYLNEKNFLMQWLKNEGIIVFSFADFDKDLKDGNIQLDYETAEKNLEKLKQFSKKYTKEDFQKIIYNKIVK